MASQQTIAAALGLNQSTVSRALRGDPALPKETRERVLAEARRIGYHPNAYVTSLMAQVRSGRPLRDKGCIALLINAPSVAEWTRDPVYEVYYEGLRHRAEELGFYTECFCFEQAGKEIRRIDDILYNRGIKGLVFTPSWQLGDAAVPMHLDRYACVATGYRWPLPVDRVANDHYQNVAIAYEHLLKRGYRRIGLCLPLSCLQSTSVTSRWLGGFAHCEAVHKPKVRLPPLYGNPGEIPPARFRRWLREHRPDVLLTLVAHPMEWLDAMKWEVPGDIALACVIRPVNSRFSGVEEPNRTLGAITLEQVAGKIVQNQFGFSTPPRLTMIAGQWVEGHSC